MDNIVQALKADYCKIELYFIYVLPHIEITPQVVQTK